MTDHAGEPNIQNATIRDSVAALQSKTSEILSALLSDLGPASDILTNFDYTEIANAQLFAEGEAGSFTVFGFLMPPKTIDHSPHELLFWLTNNIGALKLHLEADEKDNDIITRTALNVAVEAAYLSSYFELLGRHIDGDMFQKLLDDPDNTHPVLTEMATAQNEIYTTQLRNLALCTEAYAAQLKTMADDNALPDLPVIPVVFGHALGEDAFLINIYMDRQKAELMQQHLASLQEAPRY